MKQLLKLIDVKSIVTLSLTGVFSYLAIIGKINNEDFKLIFVMIITYYFTRNIKKG